MPYAAKDYGKLIGMNGFSETLGRLNLNDGGDAQTPATDRE